MWRRRSLRRAGLLLALAGALAMAVPASHQAEADPRTSPPTHAPNGVGSTDPNHDGYYWLDYSRAVGGLGPLAPNATMQAQEASHIRYLADHSLGCETDVHDELIGPGAGCGA